MNFKLMEDKQMKRTLKTVGKTVLAVGKIFGLFIGLGGLAYGLIRGVDTVESTAVDIIEDVRRK